MSSEHVTVELGPRTLRAVVAAIMASRNPVNTATTDNAETLAGWATDDADALLARLAETSDAARGWFKP